MLFWALLLLIRASEGLKNATVCSGQEISSSRGVITSSGYPKHIVHPTLTWCSIALPDEAVTTVRVISTSVHNAQVSCQCCNFLEIKGNGKNARRICDDKKYNPFLVKGRVNITFQYNFLAPSGAMFALHYAVSTNCGRDNFSCMTTSGCFTPSQICDGAFQCADHSDEINCAFCGKNLAPCNNTGVKCFEVLDEHCDGRFQCPRANDEINCFEGCSEGVRCANGRGCFLPEQVCDGRANCMDASDEVNCTQNFCELHPKERKFFCGNDKCIAYSLVSNGVDDCGDGSDEKENAHKTVVAILVVGSCLFGLFVTILCCWCNGRRDIDHLIANMPEFPLPPFQGPGGSSTHCNIACESLEIRGDEEMFEAYLETRSESGGSRRRQRSTRSIIVRPSRSCSIIKTNTNCTAITLASLGVSPEDCLDLDPICLEHHSNHFEFLEHRKEVAERKRVASSASCKVPSKQRKRNNKVDCAGDRIATSHIEMPDYVLSCKPSTSGYRETAIDVEIT